MFFDSFDHHESVSEFEVCNDLLIAALRWLRRWIVERVAIAIQRALELHVLFRWIGSVRRRECNQFGTGKVLVHDLLLLVRCSYLRSALRCALSRFFFSMHAFHARRASSGVIGAGGGGGW